MRSIDYTLAFLADVHLDPSLPPCPAWEGAKKFVKAMQPDWIILGGDFMNMGALSHWDLQKRGLIEGKRYWNEIELAQKELDYLQKHCKKARFVYLEGNHEHWAKQYLERNPEMLGFIDVVKNLCLRERGFEWVEINRVYRVGKMNFLHGWYVNKYHANKTLQVMGDNCMYGHMHDHQATIMRLRASQEQYIAIAVGCLCDLNPHYQRNKPNRWVHGFGWVEYYGDGEFQAHHLFVNNGKVAFGGKVY
ncbi:MAG: metallophosphoesterase [Deltaproteobacteria bacterium]|nr:metallophosphoesterase [Deltaproteobacteria bacterium]MBW2081604.1 metallophosphoesterase [Deltaproteobacteria bacterium]